MNRAQFQALADLRISEAEILLGNGMFEGAYYLSGYSVECGLKACIAKRTNQYDFPEKNVQRDYYTHDFDILLRTAGLASNLDADRKADVAFEANWLIVKRWKEDSRYDLKGPTTKADAEDIIQVITNDKHGVLTWLKRFW